MHRTTAPAAAFALAAFVVAPATLGAIHGVAPAGGGLGPLEVSVDLSAGVVQAGALRVPISLDPAQRPSEAEVVVEPIPIGQGRNVMHVRIPARGDAAGLAWEALLASGRAQPIFAGLTGPVGGDPGERTGKAVQVLPSGSTNFVLVGDVREDLRICGQSITLLEPLAIYPSSLDLRSATVQRIPAADQARAEPIVATPAATAASPPLAALLVARGSSVGDSRGAELTDGDVQTAWAERRPGAGQGEFVVMSAPRDVPIARMRVVPVPPSASRANAAAPRTFFLVTSDLIFEVTLPDDAWTQRGAYELTFPKPITASCLALVLDSAYTRGLAHPEVTVAELEAFSEFDVPGATLDDVAKKLSGERGVAAAQVLERAGDGALAAVERAFDGLDARGRALAIDVAASHERCDEAAPLLARGLCNRKGEASRKAREKLERCPAAGLVLAKRVREDSAVRACVAPTLAAIAPLEALEPLADAMAATPETDHQTRSTLRGAFADALKAAPPGRLASLLGDTKRDAAARLEILRAAEGRLGEAPTESEAAVTALLGGEPPVRTRYLVLGPLEELARAGDRQASARVAQAIVHDPEWPVRARAAEAGAGLADAQGALLAASADPEPRVREAALQSLAAAPDAAAIRTAETRLSQDGWSFVRIQAVGVLGKATAGGHVDDVLGKALGDRAAPVRGAVLGALALRRVWSWRKEIRARLDDQNEEAEVRSAAAHALGAVCDAESAERLTQLARQLGIPGTTEEEQQVALGALAGLGALQPPDLRKRLDPLLAASAPAVARAAAAQALEVRGTCQGDGVQHSR
jgi:hypothetical protein